MNKCCASQDGICRNAILFGTKCDGYKERCTLRPAYSTLERTVKNYQHNLTYCATSNKLYKNL